MKREKVMSPIDIIIPTERSSSLTARFVGPPVSHNAPRRSSVSTSNLTAIAATEQLLWLQLRWHFLDSLSFRLAKFAGNTLDVYRRGGRENKTVSRRIGRLFLSRGLSANLT